MSKQDQDGYKIYLGDGAYASFNGDAIRVYAPRDHGEDEVFLGWNEFMSLLRFALQIGWLERTPGGRIATENGVA